VSPADEISAIQACIDNPLNEHRPGEKRIAGIIGDAPSHYAKSPAIWNATFDRLQMEAVYLPFDVQPSRLRDLTKVLKDSERFMGGNVTVPYKIRIADMLDGLDEKTAQIGAVNTIVRAGDGRLLGYNTDGSGFLESVLNPRCGEGTPFMNTLKGVDVLMIGAGGSARAVAFYLAEAIGKGTLIICNRSYKAAAALASDIAKAGGNARAITEEKMGERAPKVGLIVNCSTKGQGGIRKLADGTITILEPYSALAPAHPKTFPDTDADNPAIYLKWLTASLADLEANLTASLRAVLAIPLGVAFCDLIYAPRETVFLRHGRLSGHRTLNGKGMNVAQAADAFYNKVCRAFLEEHGMYRPETYERVVEIMFEAW